MFNVRSADGIFLALPLQCQTFESNCLHFCHYDSSTHPLLGLCPHCVTPLLVWSAQSLEVVLKTAPVEHKNTDRPDLNTDPMSDTTGQIKFTERVCGA